MSAKMWGLIGFTPLVEPSFVSVRRVQFQRETNIMRDLALPEQLCAESVWEGGPSIGSRVLWDALSTQPGIGLVLLDETGRVIMANEDATKLCLNTTPDEVLDKLVSELLPVGVAAEISDTIGRVLSSDVNVIRRTVWNGHPLQATFRSVPTANDEKRFVLVTTRVGMVESIHGNTEYAETRHVELGELDILTPREIEVLALMGEGRRIKEIATMLSRSPKTIESHKEGIGRKLRVTDRARFIEIARDAGLQVETAFRERVRLESNIPARR